MMRTLLFFSVLSGLLLLTSLPVKANNPSEQRPISTVMNAEDPYEDFNRAMFDFNLKFNDAVGVPATNAYKATVPQPIRTGIGNFFDNLSTPISAINSFLQGKFEDGFSEVMRFSINSTFGLFGLLDIATPAGLTSKNEDFGQTLYHWGLWDNSSYLVLPILGPYTTRGLSGRVVDATYDPTYNTFIKTDAAGRVWIFTARGFVEFAEIADLITEIKTQPDPYIFSRESYLQLRTNQIYDGNAPQPALDDFNFE